MRRFIHLGSSLAITLALASPALAQDEALPADDAGSTTFTLGQIVVTGARPEGLAIGSETLTAEAI